MSNKYRDSSKHRILCAVSTCGADTVGSSRYCRDHLRTERSGRTAEPDEDELTALMANVDREFGGGKKGALWTPETFKGYDRPGGHLGKTLADTRPRCQHTGVTPCLTLSDGRKLYAAQGHEVTHQTAEHAQLILDCAGHVRIGAKGKPFVRSTNRRFRSLNIDAAGRGPDMVRLEWPDRTAPEHVRPEFWRRLLGMLPQDTIVACYGAHGRTGTALACLLVADGMPAGLAIARVRSDHCKRAIETTDQERYIHRVDAGLNPRKEQ